MVLSEAKAWFLGHVVMILGVVLVLTGLYASWLHFVTVPRLDAKVKSAEAASKVWEANYASCTTANAALASSVDRQTASIRELAAQGAMNQAEVAGLLLNLGKSTAGVKTALKAFKPDPKKSDCENAQAELNLFKIERGR